MEISALQKERAAYLPKLPMALRGAVKVKEGKPTHSVDNQDEIKKLFPNTYGLPLISFEPGEIMLRKRVNVGVILSGGQAPGGHNVISGLFDRLKQLDPENRLYGFLMGPSGLVDHNYKEITADFVEQFRNTGGFDMIGSGRTKLEEVDQFEKGMEIIRKLDIQALVIIGGDDSNTNACMLAEYYAAKKYGVQVIGCPKTIDGDMKNDQVETSFGFDTAAKKDLSLNDIVEYIATIVAHRAAQGNNFGVVLVPEGLIEFIPAIGRLIQDLNDLLATNGDEYRDLDEEAQWTYILDHLKGKNRATFATLPKEVALQLSLDRDPHGNVPVSLIETEKLLSDMVGVKLAEWKKEGLFVGKYAAQHHFFGYEGRCAAPSNFDADYCYALGTSAAMLIACDKTGYMALVKHLTEKSEDWVPGGVPLTMMMNMERRNGKLNPVIRKALVNLNGRPFQAFAARREEWARKTCYLYPGPVQYWGPSDVCDQTTLTLRLDNEDREQQKK